MLLLLLSFIAGVLTVLAPCTISLLPVIVGGTVGGGTSYRRAVVVAVSLGVSIIAFTLLLKVSTLFLTIPPEVWQYISGGIIIMLGLAMVFPVLWDKLPFLNRINQSSNKVIGTGYMQQNTLGDILIGMALGPVFSSCSPTYFLILAEVLPRSLVSGLIYLLVYAFGLCVSLLILAVAGQKLLEKAGIASDPNGYLKRGIGVIFLALGIIITIGYDKKLELAVANHIFDVTTIERSLLQKENQVNNSQNSAEQNTTATESASQENTTGENQTEESISSSSTQTSSTPKLSAQQRIASKAKNFIRSPEITNPSGYINTNDMPITIGQFKGKKVVLIDFWTYSCINCQRTLPYLKAWYDKYHDQGLEIVSIHTPEFSFEKVKSNVERAVMEDGVKYPVVMDNDYGTWGAFSNQFWPRKYLVDIDGFIVYDHAGEGAYDITEQAIQKALKERSDVLGATSTISGMSSPKGVVVVDASKVMSPETYFGSNRNEYLGNGTVGTVGVDELTVPEQINKNMLYLGGTWNFAPEYAQATKKGNSIVYTYDAKDVYFVASSIKGTRISVTLDGKPVGENKGADLDTSGGATIQENRLYKIIQGKAYGVHTLKIDILDDGLEAYTFTFG